MKLNMATMMAFWFFNPFEVTIKVLQDLKAKCVERLPFHFKAFFIQILKLQVGCFNTTRCSLFLNFVSFHRRPLKFLVVPVGKPPFVFPAL